MSAEIINLSDALRPSDEMYVYSPADRVLETQVGGNMIRFCPSTEDWGFGSGITRIVGYTWYYREGRDGTLTIKAQGAAKMTAQEVVEFLLGADGRSGDMARAGVRPLLNDPKRDETLKAEARKVWSEKRYFDARNKVRAHEAAVEKARVAGTETPSYSKEIDDAYKTKAEFERGGYAPQSTHPCPVCNAPAYTEAEREIHLRDAHQQKPKPPEMGGDAMVSLLSTFMAQQTALMDRMAKIEERPKRGRPPKKPEGE